MCDVPLDMSLRKTRTALMLKGLPSPLSDADLTLQRGGMIRVQGIDVALRLTRGIQRIRDRQEESYGSGKGCRRQCIVYAYAGKRPISGISRRNVTRDWSWAQVVSGFLRRD